MVVSTPKRPGRGPPSTPRSGASVQSVMDCSSDPQDFSIVKIHTAKCARCDLRNRDTMRRCPGCTYQVCQPCFDIIGHAPLKHGNNMDVLLNLPPTPVRRRPWSASPAKTQEVSTPPAPSAASSSAVESLSNTTGSLDLQGNREVEESAQQLTPVKTPSKRKRESAKAKSSSFVSDSEDEGEDDDDFVPEGGSPTPLPSLSLSLSKRRKQTANDDVTTSRRTPRASTKNKSSTPTHRPPPMPDFGSRRVPHFPTAIPSNASEAINGDIVGARGQIAGRSYEDHVATPERGTLSTQELLDRARYHVGITQPSNDPFLRERPLENPVIRIPSSIARSFQPRLKSPEIMQNIQTQVRSKLEAGQSGPSSVESTSKSPARQAPSSGSTQTVRHLVKAEASKLHHNLAIDEDQKTAIEVSMLEAARKLTLKYKADAPPYYQQQITFGLDMLVAQLGGSQKDELARAIWETGRRVIDEFQEELSAHTPRATVEIARPQMGMHQVSPSMGVAEQPVQRPFSTGGLGNGRGGANAGPELQRSSSEHVQH